MGHRIATAPMALLIMAQAGHAMAQAIRSEVPIREVVLTDGERRYGVPIKVGNTAIEAGLDSGSTGLRILPGALGDSDANGGGDSDRYSYGAGTQFEGEVGTGMLTVGASSASSTMQLIKVVGCRPDSPHCPASRVPLSQFGIQGSGLRSEGFEAILGVNMAHADVDSPFVALGAKRWIIELPRPGSGVPGKIILNPSDDEVRGFALMPVVAAFHDQKGGMHDSVVGCILNDASKQKACGALLMDTGAPGIAVMNAGLSSTPWANGTAATLGLYDKDKLAATEQFTVGLHSHASGLSFGEDGSGTVEIMAGLSPYFAFDVLYDPDAGMVGVKPRPAAPDAPQGALANPP